MLRTFNHDMLSDSGCKKCRKKIYILHSSTWPMLLDPSFALSSGQPLSSLFQGRSPNWSVDLQLCLNIRVHHVLTTPGKSNKGMMHHLRLYHSHGTDHHRTHMGGRRKNATCSYMDDITTLITTIVCTMPLLNNLHSNMDP